MNYSAKTQSKEIIYRFEFYRNSFGELDTIDEYPVRSLHPLSELEIHGIVTENIIHEEKRLPLLGDKIPIRVVNESENVKLFEGMVDPYKTWTSLTEACQKEILSALDWTDEHIRHVRYQFDGNKLENALEKTQYLIKFTTGLVQSLKILTVEQGYMCTDAKEEAFNSGWDPELSAAWKEEEKTHSHCIVMVKILGFVLGEYEYIHRNIKYHLSELRSDKP